MKNPDAPELPPPLHMDKWSRNERLYQQLLNMGLFCNPIFNTEGKIEALYVATELPVNVTSVGVPMKRTQVAEIVTSAACEGSNVVNFPTVL
jgi:hypothetical protein